MLSEQQRTDLQQRIASAERRVRSRNRWSLLRRTVAGSAIVLAVLLLADVTVIAYFGQAGLALVRQDLAGTAPQDLLKQPAALAPMEQHVHAARNDLQRAQVALRPWTPLLSRLHWLPTYGPAVASVAPLLDSASCLLGVAVDVGDVAQVLMAQSDQASGPTGDLRSAMQALDRERPAIATAQEDLQCAITTRKQVDPRLEAAPGRLGTALAQLDSGLTEANSGLSTLALLPPAADSLLGEGTPRTYLVLGQDPFELRATGGFIGGMGLVTVANGAITSLDYRGILGFEPANQTRLEPPPPLVKYMGLGGWYLRDANWSPDFPTSARQIETFFRMDQGVQADGVVALDLYAVQDLLAAVGPVNIPAYNETVTADTLLPQLWAQINAAGNLPPAREQEKTDYLTALVGALLQRLQQPNAVAMPRLFSAVMQAVQERHLLVYAADANVEALAVQAQADGAVATGAGDHLEVVDSQVSYAKMAAVVDESFALDVTIGTDGQVASDVLTVNYVNNYAARGAQRVWRELHSELFDFHTGTIVSAAGIMATYVRVLIPPGSTVTDVQGGDDRPGFAIADGHSELSSYVVVSPSEPRTLRFRYVPHVTGVPAGAYDLAVQKQPGTVAEPLAVRLHLPPSLAVETPTAGWTLAAPQVWEYHGDLRVDRRFEIHWRLP